MRFSILYQKDGSSYSRTACCSSAIEYTLTGLDFEQEYNISIRADIGYSYCYASMYGEYSNTITVRTMETGQHNSIYTTHL